MGILITRPADESISLLKALAQFDDNIFIEPLLSIERVAHSMVFASDLDALIFTSVNGVRFAQLAHLDVMCFCVGEATAAAARSRGITRVIVCGPTASELFDLISINYTCFQRFFYICGQDISLEIASIKTISICRVTVYRSIAQENFSTSVCSQFIANNISKVLLFSYKTAQSFVACVQKGKIDLEHVTLYCLSEKVALPVMHLACKTIKISSQPDKKNIIKLLQET